MSSARAPRDSNGGLSMMRRYPQDGWIAGVCAGIADYFGWSTKLIRVLMILAFIFSGFFPVGVIYIALWYLMDPAEAPVPASAASGSGGTDDARRGSSSREPATVETANARFDRLERRLRQIEAGVTQEELELRRQFKNLEA